MPGDRGDIGLDVRREFTRGGRLAAACAPARVLTLLLSLATTLVMAAVDVNKASEADLDSITGIGPGTSLKIMEQRKVAPFKNWADLITRVPGIGDKRAAKLSEQGLNVNGEGFKPTAAAAAVQGAEAPTERKGRAYRELFQLVREHLGGTGLEREDAADTEVDDDE